MCAGNGCPKKDILAEAKRLGITKSTLNRIWSLMENRHSELDDDGRAIWRLEDPGQDQPEDQGAA